MNGIGITVTLYSALFLGGSSLAAPVPPVRKSSVKGFKKSVIVIPLIPVTPRDRPALDRRAGERQARFAEIYER